MTSTGNAVKCTCTPGTRFPNGLTTLELHCTSSGVWVPSVSGCRGALEEYIQLTSKVLHKIQIIYYSMWRVVSLGNYSTCRWQYFWQLKCCLSLSTARVLYTYVVKCITLQLTVACLCRWYVTVDWRTLTQTDVTPHSSVTWDIGECETVYM